jgi:seryl-tRNA synthetase
MLDPNYIVDNREKVIEACTQKGVDSEVVEQFLEVADKRSQMMVKAQELRAQRNELSHDRHKKPSQEVIEKGRELKDKLRDIEADLRQVEEEYEKLLLTIPNVPAEEVPVGDQPKVVKTWGEKTEFSFEPRNHIELGKKLNLIDFERGTKVAGFRGYFLKNELVLMHIGLMQYALAKLIKKGFQPFTPPVLDRKDCFYNTGHFPWGEEEAYQTDDGYLAGTAEVPMVSYHKDEVLKKEDLPLKYVAFSSCFRREIGSHGKDTKGIYRVHEFLKVEQVVIAENNKEKSLQWLEDLLQNSEELLQELKIPYRVCLMPTGDMGEPQIKKYDVEAWMPGRVDWGETMSDSYMGEFQARRANIKYEEKNERQYVHTLNNTALASPRILVAILENYQQEDGSIKVPAVLQEYVGKEVIKPE